MPYVSMAIFVSLVGVALAGGIVYAMAVRLLRPVRMGDGKALAVLRRMSPQDIGLSFEPMNFTVHDAAGKPLRLAGWWMPAVAPGERAVVLLHGYADAKIGAIAWAPLWQSLGWNVLAVDLRAHGESDGRDSTGGFFERDDVSQVIDGLRNAKPRSAVDIALFGVSLGAAVACGVAALRDDICAVVLDSPFDDYAAAVREWAGRSSLPLPSLAGVVCRVGEWISGARFAAVRPVDLIPHIAAPVLVIHGGDDDFLAPAQLDRIKTALSQRPPTLITEHLIVPGAAHNLALAADPATYRQHLSAFLERCRPPAVASTL